MEEPYCIPQPDLFLRPQALLAARYRTQDPGILATTHVQTPLLDGALPKLRRQLPCLTLCPGLPSLTST